MLGKVKVDGLIACQNIGECTLSTLEELLLFDIAMMVDDSEMFIQFIDEFLKSSLSPLEQFKMEMGSNHQEEDKEIWQLWRTTDKHTLEVNFQEQSDEVLEKLREKFSNTQDKSHLLLVAYLSEIGEGSYQQYIAQDRISAVSKKIFAQTHPTARSDIELDNFDDECFAILQEIVGSKAMAMDCLRMYLRMYPYSAMSKEPATTRVQLEGYFSPARMIRIDNLKITVDAVKKEETIRRLALFALLPQLSTLTLKQAKWLVYGVYFLGEHGSFGFDYLKNIDLPDVIVEALIALFEEGEFMNNENGESCPRIQAAIRLSRVAIENPEKHRLPVVNAFNR